jgi:hypothetical protein
MQCCWDVSAIVRRADNSPSPEVHSRGLCQLPLFDLVPPVDAAVEGRGQPAPFEDERRGIEQGLEPHAPPVRRDGGAPSRSGEIVDGILGCTPRADHHHLLLPSRELEDAWVALLGRWRWEWFCTLTFRDHVHPEAAAKRFDAFAARINRALYGPRWHKHQVGIQWVRALEYQRQGIIHFHAAIAGAASEQPSTWEQVWDGLAGYARIGPIRNMTAALRYLTKYVRRGGELDFEPRMRAPQP